MTYSDESNGCGGRPSLFNAATTRKIVHALRRGLTYKQAADYAGVSYSTLNRWRLAGREEDAPEPFRKFWKACARANADAALKAVDCINSAVEGGDWKAASFFLQRRYPSEWSHSNSDFDPTDPPFPL